MKPLFVLPMFTLLAAMAFAANDESLILDAVHEEEGVFTLAPGPNVEGVVFLRQGDWPEETIKAFHDVPWIDAASIRIRWADLEPEEQEFDWKAIDKILNEVKKYNEAHPEAPRTLHIRVMGGEHVPEWMEGAGVKMYDTKHAKGAGKFLPLHIPVPYDNPEFIKQLHEVYAAMYKRYKDEPLVTVYHGTWSAGPWDEIYHPQGEEPLPPEYTKEKFVEGMIEQLDVLLEEFALKGKVCELPYSGKYPQKTTINLVESLTNRVIERLGRRSPFFYAQTNGWGQMSNGYQTVSWGHTRDIQDTYGSLNLAFQALGTNAGKGWMPQGDWISLVKMAKDYEVSYAEIYDPDFMPVDDQHNMSKAFLTGDKEFTGFKSHLRQRNRTLYVGEGKVIRAFVCDTPQKINYLVTSQAVPEQCSVEYLVRSRNGDGEWSEWVKKDAVAELPEATEAEVEATLHTDDGYFTPRIILMEPDAGESWDAPVWYPKGGQLPASQPVR